MRARPVGSLQDGHESVRSKRVEAELGGSLSRYSITYGVSGRLGRPGILTRLCARSLHQRPVKAYIITAYRRVSNRRGTVLRRWFSIYHDLGPGALLVRGGGRGEVSSSELDAQGSPLIYLPLPYSSRRVQGGIVPCPWGVMRQHRSGDRWSW